MPHKIWINDRLVDRDKAHVDVYDHGFLYGDGVFEGIRVYGGRVFKEKEHLRRLFDSANAIRLTIPMSQDDFARAIATTVAATGLSDCYVRAIVARGTGTLGISPTRCPRASVIIIADTIDLYPRELYETGMPIITSTVCRNHPNALSPRVKSLNYLNNVLAKIEAIDAGVPEAVMLNPEGHVAECTGDNIFIVRGGEVQTPATHDGILEGITRGAVLDLCRKLAIPAVEKTLQRLDLYVADECFLTGTAAEVIPVTSVDKRHIGDGKVGPITRRLTKAFHELVRA